MTDAPRSNRPAPRTAAAIEAELRRRIRADLTQARADSETGELDDAELAAIIARAVAAAVGWHLEAPEHTRGATSSSRSWRSAGGPRAGGPRQFDEDRPARGGFEQRPSRGPRDVDRAPRDLDRGPRDVDRGPRDVDRGPRDVDRGPRNVDRGPRDFDRGPRNFNGGGRREFDPGRPPARGGGFSRGVGFKRGGGANKRPPRG